MTEKIYPEYGVDSRYASDEERKTAGKELMKARLKRLKTLSPELIMQARLLASKLENEGLGKYIADASF